MINVVHGSWTEWTPWNNCSVSCGGGTHWRTRLCQGIAFGGKGCEGVAAQQEACNSLECPGEMPFQNNFYVLFTLYYSIFVNCSIHMISLSCFV